MILAHKTALLTLAACLLLVGCVSNPNINQYSWRPPPGPSPEARSFLGYDENYEQKLINRYVAENPERVRRFRTEQLGE